MSENSQQHKDKPINKMKIFAYGFDKAGFSIPEYSVKLTNTVTIEFIRFEDSKSLDIADGVIIPQGIFEKFKLIPTPLWKYIDVYVAEDNLLMRERQVRNLLEEGKWICFLISEIVDKVRQRHDWKNVDDTDLCKRILNHYEVNRELEKGLTSLDVKDDEFKLYFRDYGIANTILRLPYNAKDRGWREIAKSEYSTVGAEYKCKLFLLPFHSANRDAKTAELVAKLVTKAIIDYRQKRIVQIPAWLDEFKFQFEEKLEEKINSLQKQLNVANVKLQNWKNYKAILTTSGDILKNMLIKILEDYFDLIIDPIDEKREDAKIIDDQNNVLVLLELKGTKSGIKRNYINQVDSHRELNELDYSILGVLFINNEMDKSGIDKRLETKVPSDHIKHAKNLNILIVRTIDLLFLMKHLEDTSNRKDELMNLLNSGGGWLRADYDGYEIISE